MSVTNNRKTLKICANTLKNSEYTTKNKPYFCGSTLLSDPDTTIVTHLLSKLLEVFLGIYKHYDYIYMKMYA